MIKANTNETTYIATFENVEDDIKVYVTVGNMGFHVSIQDTDSGEFVPIVKGYKDKATALQKAAAIANGIG